MGIIVETKSEPSELTFNSNFKTLHYYLGALMIIIVAAIIVIFIRDPQLRIWALLAGAAGLIYIANQLIRFNQIDKITFKKSGIFLEKFKSSIPKDVILKEDIDNLEVRIRKSRIKVDEEKEKGKTPVFRFWLEMIIIKQLGERIELDLRKFLSGSEEEIFSTAEVIQSFCKKKYNLDVEIIEDTNIVVN